MSASSIYRHIPGDPLPTPSAPEPVPTVERTPKTIDGCTWHAYAVDQQGQRIGGTGRTKKQALEEFSEKWAIFA